MDEKERFDIVVTTPCQSDAERLGLLLGVHLDSLKQNKVVQVGMLLAKARECLGEIRAAGGNGILMPIRYRTLRVTKEEARRIALNALERVKSETGNTYGELSEAHDEFLWWAFTADNFDAQTAGVIPGVLSIGVDKVDGHVRTEEELYAWASLCVDE